jgi:thiamine-phosphate pyrophosphorylase
MTPLPRLYAIADASFGDPVDLARALFSGGALLVQVRNKTASSRELLHQVQCIIGFAPAGARVIVNDRVDIALIAGADGVHLGQTDLPPVSAREILGPDRIIGFSTHNLRQAEEADKLPIDYLAAGPVFPTLSKENQDPALGIEKLAEICGRVRKPLVAIGGIRLDNAGAILNAGAASVAVIRDLLVRDDIPRAVRTFADNL